MVLGVTGGFGVGKSTVCKIFETMGAVWLEADRITHELYKPGKTGFQKIRGYFGEEFVDASTGVRRDKLRDVVLQNPQKLWILNKLMHPLIAAAALREIRSIKREKGDAVLICFESLYLEQNDFGKLVDKVLLVRRSPELVVAARKKSKWKLADIERFMALSPVCSKPDFVLENNGTVEELEAKLSEVVKRLRH